MPGLPYLAAEAVYAKPIPQLGYQGRYVKAPLVAQTPNGPVAKAWYPIRLPKADAFGNALGGVRLPIVAAPRATYTGWNPQAGFDGPEDLCTQFGGSLPLAATPAEAAAAHDPRPSLASTYPTPDGYVTLIRMAAEVLQAERLLLATDAEAAVRAAQAAVGGGAPAVQR